MRLIEKILSPLPGDMLARLHQADQQWHALRHGTLPIPNVIKPDGEPLSLPDWDAVICGGTLGIMLGAALAQSGWRVALIERGQLRGRDQEWNISRRELTELVELGLLTPEELEQAIATEYNPARISFGGGKDLWVRDVLNVGVDPVYLLETLKQKFLAAGGHLLEHTAFSGAVIHPNGVNILAGEGLQARLLIDAMGHFSPIARQARNGQPPDAVCLVVGTCATGYSHNETGDLIASFTPIQDQRQYFWEAFPARDGRTTYLFTYLDAKPNRPSLETLFEDYLNLLPQYQSITLEQLEIKRALFGFFPCYRNSPLQYPWGRSLAVGDSSGNQSPLSFGGFGAMIRHLPRLTEGIDDALRSDCLDAQSLGWLQPYQPNLSVTWLFQKSMSVGLNQQLPAERINETLAAIFQDMASLGEATLKPFLQDVVQFPALAKTLLKTSVVHPNLVAKIIPQVGPIELVRWLGHYGNLASSSVLYPLVSGTEPLTRTLPTDWQYRYRRWRDALKYGTGRDYSQ